MVALTLTPQLRSFLADVQAVVDGVGTKVLDDARIPQDEIGYMYKVVEKYHPGSAAAAGAESVKSVVSAKKRDDDTISKEVAETTLQTIHHKDLHRLSQFMLAIHSNDSKYSFRELVKGSKINVESPRPRVKSPELQKILNDVRTQLENQEYERMVRNVSTYTGEQRPLESFSKDLRNVSKLMSSIMNVLFSVGAAFVAVFYFSYTVSEDISVRTLLAVTGGLIVAIAEGWFFSRDWFG
ncbi:hypothetical protein HK102_003041 [Quaeritorhiza haematococci]|nr:hypothetical protein HK102_003041 [Quaeritorhiza haematococci]